MQPLSDTEKVIYWFDAFELDPTRRLLLKQGQVVQLTPKVFETLLVLVRSRGRVMSKDELMQAVWPDTIVEETNLAHNISTLRKLLGQKTGDNRFIVTTPGRGYSFVAEVRESRRGNGEASDGALAASSRTVDDSASSRTNDDVEAGATSAALPMPTTSAPVEAATPVNASTPAHVSQPPHDLLITRHHFSIRWRTALGLVVLVGLIAAAGLIWLRPAPTHPIRSLAVLPFKPLVADTHDDILEMGIADTLITRLNSLKQITVRPISAVRRYTALDQDAVAAGRELEVEAVLDGNIQKANGKIRVSARLVRIADGKPLWTRQFDEPATDIFAVQDAIAQRVAGDMMGSLSGDEHEDLAKNYTTDPEAYQLYLVGRYYWNKRSGEGTRKSIESFQKAIDKDANYALAYVGLADAYTTLGSYGLASPLEALPRAREAAEQALRIDPNLAEAHATLGKIFTDFDWDWVQAEKEFKLALDIKPNYANSHHWYAVLLSGEARFDEAIREIKRAVELDYLSPATSNQYGIILFRARRYDEAVAVLQKTLDLEPNFIVSRIYLGGCYLMQGRREEAIAEFKRGLQTAPDSGPLIAMLGYAYGVSGQLEEARRCEQQLKELETKGYVAPSNYAALYCGMGDKAAAFKWLEVCLEKRVTIRGLPTDPLFDPLRNDPRYADLMRRANIKQ
jgi:DNA-binding winged helix-turn-helix (wHTH) protein/TolB-like protein/tetratricopeptide (TPR) repeat protein